MGGFGAFGKVPAAGDFIRFGLSPGMVASWDKFLQRAMTHARGSLAGRWRECYFTAPMWRFTMGSGQMGRHGCLGVMMPSVDRVGRQFPLVMVLPLMSPQPTAQLHLEARLVFEALEAIALAALDDLPLEQLRRRIEMLRPPPPSHSLRETARPGGAAYSLNGNADIAAVLAARALPAGLSSPGIWSAALSRGSRVLVCDGLPDAEACVALFDTSAALWPGGAVA